MENETWRSLLFWYVKQRNIPEERKSQLHRGGSLISRMKQVRLNWIRASRFTVQRGGCVKFKLGITRFFHIFSHN
jgi:hypothetical protein